jgi:phospholipase/lecithinase/hemolysin
MKSRQVAALLAAALLTSAVPATALTPSAFYIFGDSFTDAGNIAAATGNTIPDPAQGYWQGRFADGRNWADYLSNAALGHVTTASLTGGTNFSFGGARAAQDDQVAPGVFIPGLATQFGMYAAASGGAVDPNGLYVLNFGNNDVGALLSGDTEGLTVAQYRAAYVGNMVGAVQQLSLAGAQNILVAGVPNPTQLEGQILQGMLLSSLSAVTPTLSANVHVYDYFSFFTRLAANPTQFGLPANLDFTTPCLAGEIPGPGIDCTGYLSFDGTHVTSAVQRAIAQDIARQVGLPAVPEPASWAMMIAGFGLVGSALRRRRVVAHSA